MGESVNEWMRNRLGWSLLSLQSQHHACFIQLRTWFLLCMSFSYEKHKDSWIANLLTDSTQVYPDRSRATPERRQGHTQAGLDTGVGLPEHPLPPSFLSLQTTVGAGGAAGLGRAGTFPWLPAILLPAQLSLFTQQSSLGCSGQLSHYLPHFCTIFSYPWPCSRLVAVVSDSLQPCRL